MHRALYLRSESGECRMRQMSCALHLKIPYQVRNSPNKAKNQVAYILHIQVILLFAFLNG
jgi:hypothetical protein